MNESRDVTARGMSYPSESRADLAEILIQSLEEEDNLQVKAAWVEEIRRRDEQIRAGKAVTRPARQALTEAREPLRCAK